MSTLERMILLLALGLTLTSCARNTSTSQSVSTPNAAPSDRSAESTAAVPARENTAAPAAQAFVDPTTGELRAPTEAEQAELLKQRTQSKASLTESSSTSSSVRVTPLANGITEYDLGTRAHVQETVCIQANGELGECTAEQLAKLRQPSAAHKP